MILYYVIKFLLNAIIPYLSTNVNVWGVNMFVLFRSFAWRVFYAFLQAAFKFDFCPEDYQAFVLLYILVIS